MFTRRMEGKFQELKCYFNAKMSEQGEDLTKILNNLLIDPQKEITKQSQIEIKSHCKHLEFANQMLKNQVSEVLESVNSLFKQLKYIFRNQLLIVLIELTTDI